VKDRSDKKEEEIRERGKIKKKREGHRGYFISVVHHTKQFTKTTSTPPVELLV
jgi:hypothetical protein